MEENTLKKQIDRLIDSKSGVELWKEAVYAAVKHNPEIAKDVNSVIKGNRAEREALVDQKFGTSKTGSMRHGLRMPFSVEAVLQAVDPDHFPMTNENDYKDTIKKLSKAFPEFVLPQKL